MITALLCAFFLELETGRKVFEGDVTYMGYTYMCIAKHPGYIA